MEKASKLPETRRNEKGFPALLRYNLSEFTKSVVRENINVESQQHSHWVTSYRESGQYSHYGPCTARRAWVLQVLLLHHTSCAYGRSCNMSSQYLNRYRGTRRMSNLHDSPNDGCQEGQNQADADTDNDLVADTSSSSIKTVILFTGSRNVRYWATSNGLH